MADFLARRWRLQPRGPVELDRSNPLVQDARLVAAFLNGVSLEYVRNAKLGLSGSAAPGVNHRVNENALYLEQSTVSYAQAASSAELNITGEVTVLYRFNYTSASSVGAHIGKNTGNGGTATPYGVDFTTTYIRAIRSNTTFKYYDASTGLAHDTVHTALVAFPGAIDSPPTFYRNGAEIAVGVNSGTGTGTPTTNTNALRIGARVDSAVRQTGYADLAIVWPRKLTNGEAQEITFAPWQVFKPRRSLFYSIPAGAAFNPAWAANSNTYLGGGLYA